MTSKAPIMLREMYDADRAFIYKSWLRSYRGSGFATDIPSSFFFDNHQKIVTRFLGDEIIIACNTEERGQIIGFISFTAGLIAGCAVINYIYVKSPYRTMGIASELLVEAKAICEHDRKLPIVVTHYTKEFGKFCPCDFAYNPYLIGDR